MVRGQPFNIQGEGRDIFEINNQRQGEGEINNLMSIPFEINNLWHIGQAYMFWRTKPFSSR